MKMSQEKSKTMPMQILFFSFFFLGGGGVKEVYYGSCASSELTQVRCTQCPVMSKLQVCFYDNPVNICFGMI